ncbi:MAG: hypothetical protein AB7F22_30225 [Reyranella sp.]|uniref:hypothetical protein n=1 Tax=Reyranella sp. TaxID=1929291 RepID=UPI003D1188A4
MLDDDREVKCWKCGYIGPVDMVPCRESYDIGDARVYEDVFYAACACCGSQDIEEVPEDCDDDNE